MPELPDVEGFRRVLDSCARGCRILDVDVRDPGVLHGVAPSAFRDQLRTRTVGRAVRHGKWLVMATEDGPAVLFHFGMTGSLVCCDRAEPAHPHDRVVLDVEARRLRYRDQRKLKGLWFAEGGPEGRDARHLLGDLGPDAATVGRSEFAALLRCRRGGLKAALLNQSVVAGLGNLLADEILWRARLDPRVAARGLSGDAYDRLHAEMRRVLRSANRAGRVPPRATWLTGCRDDRDGRCPRCSSVLGTGRVAGRTTVWCPRCQPAPGRGGP